jgi:hypothetical protein
MRYTKWERWFAWYPVHLMDGSWTCFTIVEWREVHSVYDVENQYRRIKK